GVTGVAGAGYAVPAFGERGDLDAVEVLEHVVGEPGRVKKGALVADVPGADQDPGAGVAGGKAGDLVGDVLPSLGVEQFVEAVEDDQHPAGIAQQPFEQASGQPETVVAVVLLVEVVQEGTVTPAGIGVAT